MFFTAAGSTFDIGGVREDWTARQVEATYGGEDQDPIPPSLIEAVCQLAAHWYENREASIVGMSVNAMPFGVQDIIREYRNWSF